MRPDYGLTRLHVFILASLLLTLEADSEDSECDVELKVRRNTAYEAVLGEDLRINCTVVFCNNSQTVSWYKLEKTLVLVNVSSGSHIKTELKTLSHLEVISYLIFQNILAKDSGEYRCVSEGSVSHSINVFVHVGHELTTVTWTTSEPNSSTIQDVHWPYAYRVVGIVTFFIMMITIYVISQKGCKGVCCAGESRDAPDLSGQPSHDAFSSLHIYDNDK